MWDQDGIRGTNTNRDSGNKKSGVIFLLPGRGQSRQVSGSSDKSNADAQKELDAIATTFKRLRERTDRGQKPH